YVACARAPIIDPAITSAADKRITLWNIISRLGRFQLNVSSLMRFEKSVPPHNSADESTKPALTEDRALDHVVRVGGSEGVLRDKSWLGNEQWKFSVVSWYPAVRAFDQSCVERNDIH